MNKPNVTPSSHPMKFWGLLAMVSPTANITQQNFLIGSIPGIKLSHWLRQCRQELHPYMISPYEIFHAPYTYIHVTHLTSLWKNLQAYNIPHTV